MTTSTDPKTSGRCSVAVLISGSGSNLQSLIDSAEEGGYSICAVVSNKADALGLTRAKKTGIPTALLSHLAFATREDFDLALMDIIDQYEPDLVVLAGFMRILSAAFVTHYAGRLLNIHPSLLPDFAGVNTHQRALDAKVTRHGASVHFVTEELDGGPVIARHSIPVAENDTAESLAARVLQQEHALYPKVVTWFAAGELRMTDNGAHHTRIKLPDTQDFD